MDLDLSDKRALITGGAGGIGSAIGAELAAHGARVLLADLNEAAGQNAAAAIQGGLFEPADLTSVESCRALIERAEARMGGVDILVNNAGAQYVSPVEQFPEDRWERLIRLMLIAPFVLTKYALPGMYRRRWGRIINLASIQGLVASPFKSAYVSAKHGLIGFTKSIALEAAGNGVTVNAICPSYVRTALVEGQIADQAKTHGIPEDQVIEQIMLEPAAIKRLLEPREVAGYALYLCSELASGITGAAQVIDCGWTAR
ncbi:MAG: 3-hydroxybutyrate dehydrogenase [Chloroflexota bacterium]|nr:3-hydroxybutyrate dehydrogenase [Chloroflexota bacterium]